MQAWEVPSFPLAEAGERLGPRPLDSVIHRSAVVTIGAFRAFPSQRGFADSGPIERHIFVAPRTSVWIQHEGGNGFLSDPNNVCFHNRGQLYRRFATTPREWRRRAHRSAAVELAARLG